MIAPEQGWVILDVDGTIIDQNDNLRPYVIQFILALKRDNIHVGLWSGGGAGYAEGIARKWFIDDLFEGFYRKSNAVLEVLKDGVVVIDDEAVVTTGKLIRVPSYDRELHPDDEVFKELLLHHLHTEG